MAKPPAHPKRPGALPAWCHGAALAAGLALALPTQAGYEQREFVPEVNVYWQLSPLARAYVQASVVGQLTQDTTDGEFGAYVDYTLQPIFRPALQGAAWERNRYLWARAGFLFGGGQEGLKDFSERRVIVEATARVPLPDQLWVTHRAHVDLRQIDGASSQRYRYRLGVEREFSVLGTTLVPYAQAEVYYDTRFSAISRMVYQFGAELDLSHEWRVEPYWARQNDKQPERGVVHRFGLVIKFYH